MVLETLALHGSGPTRSVIEFGAGFGTHGAAIAALGHDYTGLDISLGNLHQALAHNPDLARAHLIVADAMAAPLCDASYDAAFYVGALHHVPTPEAGVSEMMRVLHPGGRFCILEPQRFYPVHFVNCLLHFRTEVSAMKMKASAIQAWLHKTGVRDVAVAYCVYTPNWPAWLIPFYDAVDTWMGRNSILRYGSVMFCVYGRK
jgi:ubiquinone/menaquinone biosynthesis C-methylase UbiE